MVPRLLSVSSHSEIAAQRPCLRRTALQSCRLSHKQLPGAAGGGGRHQWSCEPREPKETGLLVCKRTGVSILLPRSQRPGKLCWGGEGEVFNPGLELHLVISRADGPAADGDSETGHMAGANRVV